MGVRINTNIEAINAHRNLLTTSSALTRSMEKLSSGLRINRAADDAAGLAISEKMRSQIRGTNQAIRNAQDGVSLLQTAEGALAEVHGMLQRMRELSLQAANDSLSSGDREAVKEELVHLRNEITRIGNDTGFNTQKLLDGTLSASFQIGPNTGQKLTVTLSDSRATAIGTVAGDGNPASLDAAVTTFEGAATAANAEKLVLSIDQAITDISSNRSGAGALQNRLDHTITNLSVSAENLTAAESRIRDVDMAIEMMNFTKLQILQQAGTAVLAQANLSPQSVLRLLG
ncbi:MAG: flagellin [bacterium]|nr:flagellin [bacterium]